MKGFGGFSGCWEVLERYGKQGKEDHTVEIRISYQLSNRLTPLGRFYDSGILCNLIEQEDEEAHGENRQYTDGFSDRHDCGCYESVPWCCIIRGDARSCSLV